MKKYISVSEAIDKKLTKWLQAIDAQLDSATQSANTRDLYARRVMYSGALSSSVCIADKLFKKSK